MYEHKIKPDIRCPLDRGMAMLGGKWKCRILCVLGRGQLRYKDIQRQMGDITDAVLSAALRELVQDGLLERIAFQEIPPRVEYRLTQLGLDALPILDSIGKWAGAAKRPAEPGAPRCAACDYGKKI